MGFIMPQKSIFRDALYIGFYVENVKFPHSLLQNKFGYDIINISVYHNIVLNLKKGMIDL